MYDGRYPIANNLGPSAGLYHEAFARLLHEFANDKDVRLEADIPSIMSKLRHALAQPEVVDEEKYMDALEKYLPLLFPGTKFHRKYPIPRGRSPDAVLDFALTCTSPYGVEVVVVVGEAKWSEGVGGVALTQGIYGYRRVFIGIEVSRRGCMEFSLLGFDFCNAPARSHLLDVVLPRPPLRSKRPDATCQRCVFHQ